MYCMYALWLFRGPNVRGIQDHKMQGFFGLHNIQMPEFKQPDVKHDQGFCAYELTHPKQVALTQQSFTEVNLYSNRLGHEEETRTGIQRKSGSEDIPSKECSN